MSRASLPRFPEVSGRLDRDYLNAALARSDIALADDDLAVEPLLDGRTGATVQRVRVGQRSFVIKLVREGSWRIRGMGIEVGGEPLLWGHGLLRDLRGAIACPIVDVGYEPAEGRYWMLMQDVGRSIRGRGAYTREDSARLYAALATMHAHHDDSLMRDAPLPSVSGPTNLFRLPLLHSSGKAPQTADWVPTMLEDFKVMGAFLPMFLEVLGSSLADAYLALCADDTWVAMLDEGSAVLQHGDLRRANMGFDGSSISLFDWEFAARGPAGCDLQWHNLLHYWGYPPDGVEPGDDCDDLAELYLAHVEREQGGPTDRAACDRGWKLGWLKVMAQLGYVLVDPLYPDGADDATTARVSHLCRRAVERAVAMRESLS